MKNYRKIEEWEWYTTPHMAHLWQHLVRVANHRDSRWQGYEVGKGQVICGLHTLSAATGISVRSLRTCLARLEQSKEITRKSTNRFSIITINNYCKYQTEEEWSDKQPTSNRQATDKQPTTNKNVRMKEGKEEKIIGKKPAAFSPPTIEQVKEYCLERKNEVSPERWHNYYTSNGWMVGKTKMKDWQAAVRTWEKNGYGNEKARSGGRKDDANATREKWARELLDAKNAGGFDEKMGHQI